MERVLTDIWLLNKNTLRILYSYLTNTTTCPSVSLCFVLGNCNERTTLSDLPVMFNCFKINMFKYRKKLNRIIESSTV